MAESGLVVLAAPIGNVGDVTDRVRHHLGSADVVAAEDTRRVKRLAASLDIQITGRLLSYHDHNERERLDELVGAIAAGQTVAIITDAGMPGVNDPGYRLVAAAVAAGHPVTCAPGPSAVTTALILSGLPTDRFIFDGFLPRKDGERRAYFEMLRHELRTVVVFESPRRLASSIAVMREVLGDDRAVAVCRELTKTYEEVRRGTLGDVAAWAGDHEILGEVTVVIGPGEQETLSFEALRAVAVARVDAGERLKDVTKDLAAQHNCSARELYQAVLAAGGGA